ncbi:MAG TPA: periplasmic heavy metal sensor [Myxococcales bacterium]|jgi:Spy/CpxP family protein refolding chaperone
MKKTMMILTAVSLLGSTAAFAQGQDGTAPQEHSFRHRHGHGFGPQMIEKLGLTQAQQDQLASLKANMKAQVAPVRQVIQQKRAELKALWSAPNKDRSAILAKEAEIDQERGAIRAAMVDFRIAFNNLLTPQQQTQLQQMKANHQHG